MAWHRGHPIPQEKTLTTLSVSFKKWGKMGEAHPPETGGCRHGSPPPKTYLANSLAMIHHTGDKGPNTHWAHGKNIEIAVNM